ncbi:MAG: hypothetical protein QNJ97_20605 [Myxococcota bacterium]|nr:hypothetical protein [Myxococcota bacterium]
MTSVVFITIISGVVSAICLWAGGYIFGSRRSVIRFKKMLIKQRSLDKEQRDALKQKLSKAQEQLVEMDQKFKESESARLSAEGDLSGTTLKLGRLEAKMDRVKNEISKLGSKKAALIHASLSATGHSTQAGGMSKRTSNSPRAALGTLPPKAPSLLPGSPEPNQTGNAKDPDTRDAGFQTVAISSRDQSIPGSQYHRLRQSYYQLQHEKERIEEELSRSLQELEFLKSKKN